MIIYDIFFKEITLRAEWLGILKTHRGPLVILIAITVKRPLLLRIGLFHIVTAVASLLRYICGPWGFGSGHDKVTIICFEGGLPDTCPREYETAVDVMYADRAIKPVTTGKTSWGNLSKNLTIQDDGIWNETLSSGMITALVTLYGSSNSCSYNYNRCQMPWVSPHLNNM